MQFGTLMPAGRRVMNLACQTWEPSLVCNLLSLLLQIELSKRLADRDCLERRARRNRVATWLVRNDRVVCIVQRPGRHHVPLCLLCAALVRDDVVLCMAVALSSERASSWIGTIECVTVPAR